MHTTTAQRQVLFKQMKKLEERNVYLMNCLNSLFFGNDKEDLTFLMCKQPVIFFVRMSQINNLKNEMLHQVASCLNSNGGIFFAKISQINNLKKETLQQVVSCFNGKGGILLIGIKKKGHNIVPDYQAIAHYNVKTKESKLQIYFTTITLAIALYKLLQPLCIFVDTGRLDQTKLN